MKKIFKYPLIVEDRQTIKLPADFKILCIQLQGGKPTLWALVDPEADTYDYEILMSGTGWALDDDFVTHEYMDTVQMGQFVWHFFIDRYYGDRR